MSLQTTLDTRDIDDFSSLLQREEYKLKSVIYFTADIPIEIITAAGLIPIRIPSDANLQDRMTSSSVLQPFICSKSHQFINFISKYGKSLSAGIFSENHCDSLQNFYDIIKMNKTLDEDFPHFRFLLPINRGGASETKYYFKEMKRLISWFKDAINTESSYESLLDSINLHNNKRKLLQQISEFIGNSYHDKILINEFVKLKILTDIKPVNESIEILKKYIKSISTIDSDEKNTENYPRLLLSGSMFDNYKLLDSVEILNKCTVATDLTFISRSSDFQVSISNDDQSLDDLLMRIAEAYILNKIPDSVHHYPGRRKEYLLDLIDKYQIDGVVFIHYSFCDPDAFESRSLSLYLKNKMNMPTLTLVTDPKLTNQNQITTRVEAFIEQIGDSK